MAELALTKGRVAIIDDEDFNFLSNFNWYFLSNGYAASSSKINSKNFSLMHRVIMDHHGVNLKNSFVDHINRNGLDNRKINLRKADDSQNQGNQIINKHNHSGFKGIYLDKARNKYAVQICVNRKKIFLGRFKDKISAALKYNEAALEYFGEFARINIIGVENV